MGPGSYSFGDYIRIGWKQPDGTTNQPIPGTYLKPFMGGGRLDLISSGGGTYYADWNTASTPAGTYDVIATLIDGAGTASLEEPDLITIVDTLPPTVTARSSSCSTAATRIGRSTSATRAGIWSAPWCWSPTGSHAITTSSPGCDRFGSRSR